MQYIADTNFIIRYLIADNPEMFRATKELFDKAKVGSITIIIEQTVFTETVFVLSSFYKVPRDKISSTLSELLTYKGIKSDKEPLLVALDYYSKHNIHIVDSILLAKTNLFDQKLLSFDKSLLKLINNKL